jgi:hypothetical protein
LATVASSGLNDVTFVEEPSCFYQVPSESDYVIHKCGR